MSGVRGPQLARLLRAKGISTAEWRKVKHGRARWELSVAQEDAPRAAAILREIADKEAGR